MKFLWNGIKEANGEFHRVFYSDGALYHHPEGTLTIYGRDYKDFGAEIRQAFTVENGTDIQTDYIEQDHIRVLPTHPLYGEVKAAMLAMKAHNEKLAQKRATKRAA